MQPEPQYRRHSDCDQYRESPYDNVPGQRVEVEVEQERVKPEKEAQDV